MVAIKITVFLDDAGSLVFSLLTTTITRAVSENRKPFLTGPFQFSFSHFHYTILFTSTVP